ncbi:NusG domain II-containing protein [Candidatus Desantisbacteria bacterium]|nr:NusG domain II-containing protein [Candidatus Desantisbacteria bacterium]
MNKLFSFRDIIFVTTLSLFFFAWIIAENFYKKSPPGFGIVEIKGTVSKTFSLDKNCIIKVNGPLGITEIEVLEKNIHILRSACPNHICIKAGWISKAGETLICLPNKIIVKIPLSGTDDKIDAKSY